MEQGAPLPLTDQDRKSLEEVMEGRVTLTLLYVMLEDMRQEINAVRKELAGLRDDEADRWMKR